MTTPQKITSLKENQIFVFGSNLNGSHGGGAALTASEKFGAVEGIGEGPTGQSYAFPTLNKKMKKVSIKALQQSKESLYEYATKNPTLQFLVTKLGCGIAGFTEEEMKEIFKGDKPSNIILPAGWAIVKGFKAFDKGLICRGFQYELGKDFTYDGTINPCQSGFHFCKSLSDVYTYYSFGNNIVVAEIESEGDIIDDENKSVTNHLRIIRILGAEEAANNKGGNNLGHRNTGHRNTGDRNTGDRNTGDWNTGDWNTGDRNTGDRNTGDWNTGDRNTGYFNFMSPDVVLVFGKECKYEDWVNAKKPYFIYFETKEWVEFSAMTEKEHKAFPNASIQGGYIRDIPYLEAWKRSYEKASESDIKLLKALPNFDADVFLKISGIIIK